jgi:hypothetical protein
MLDASAVTPPRNPQATSHKPHSQTYREFLTAVTPSAPAATKLTIVPVLYISGFRRPSTACTASMPPAATDLNAAPLAALNSPREFRSSGFSSTRPIELCASQRLAAASATAEIIHCFFQLLFRSGWAPKHAPASTTTSTTRISFDIVVPQTTHRPERANFDQNLDDPCRAATVRERGDRRE